MAKKKRGQGRRGADDAISLLEQDHETVRKLLKQLEASTSRAAGRREELLERIAQEVRIHARIEEEIFYPAYHEAAKSGEDEKLFFEAAEEHALVDHVLPQLEAEDPSGDVFAAKAKVLKDLIEHHAEEEEDEMFPRARKLLGAARLEELGEELRERKESLQDEDLGARSSSRRPARSPSRSSRDLPRVAARSENEDEDEALS